MARKSQHLQIRVTPAQKAAVRRLAKHAGQDLSSYVLERVLPPVGERFGALVEAMADEDSRRFALAGINDLLAELAPAELSAALVEPELGSLTALDRNYLAAMVEEAAHRKRVSPPRWAAEIAPLQEPWFAVPFPSLRLHLLRSSPVPFKRRNLFVDSSVGDRV